MRTKNEKYIFPIGLFLALIVTGTTFAINLGGAWFGYPAKVGNLVTTLVYIAFWGAFTWYSLKQPSLLKITFAISLLTLISAIIMFFAVVISHGFVTEALLVIEVLMSVFVSVQFYGICYFTSWKGLYCVALVVSLAWFIFTARKMKQNKK